MSGIFQVYAIQPLWRTVWMIPGRVIEGELRVGDNLTIVSEIELSLQLKLVAIETYGHAVSSIHIGESCQMIVQVQKMADDDLMKPLVVPFDLKANA